jgi:hypothetical protein
MKIVFLMLLAILLLFLMVAEQYGDEVQAVGAALDVRRAIQEPERGMVQLDSGSSARSLLGSAHHKKQGRKRFITHDLPSVDCAALDEALPGA